MSSMSRRKTLSLAELFVHQLLRGSGLTRRALLIDKLKVLNSTLCGIRGESTAAAITGASRTDNLTSLLPVALLLPSPRFHPPSSSFRLVAESS
jgi:hypothetical protein